MKQVRHIGIDISDASVKVLSLDAQGSVFAYGHAPLPQGAVQEGHVMDGAAFAVGLRTVLAKTMPNVLSDGSSTLSAVVSIPESKLFTHVFDVPADVHESEVETHVYERAEKIIPIPLSELYMTVGIQEKEGKRRANFAGAYTHDVEMVVNGCLSAGIKPILMCGEMFSLAYSLLPMEFENAYLLVDMGAHTTTIGIFNSDHAQELSISVPYAGIFFSESVARILGISLSEAETKKRNYGLDQRYEATKVPGILRECVGEIIRVLGEARLYLEKNRGVRVTHCILTGGSSHIPGIDTLIAEHTDLVVTQGDPTQYITDRELFTKHEPSFLFANVIGLARMGVAKRLPSMNLLNNYVWETQTKRHAETASEVWRKVSTQLGIFARTVLRFKKRVLHEKMNFGIQTALTILFACSAIGFLIWVILKYT